MEPPKSPGRIHTTGGGGSTSSAAGSGSGAIHRYSPRNMSPSPHGSRLHSPIPSSPGAPLKSPLPSNVFYPGGGGATGGGCSPISPRSPSPRPPRTTRFASQPTHLTSSNLAVLANRRKTSLAVSRRHVTINPTSNFLELPGTRLRLEILSYLFCL